MSTDEKFMQRCFHLAQLGAGHVAPNPMVGSVVVCNGEIIGEGYHQKYGQAHAEANAISAVKDKTMLEKSTIYINLEPCAHFGKTPPCSDLIIASKIPNVVIGCIDSYSDSMQIVAAPTPSFVSNTACMGDTTFLTNTTLNSNSLDFTWSLGDGTTDTVISPSHVYGLAGTYTVKLVTELQSYLSCSDSVVNTVTVNDSPVADFSLNDACESESVPFTDLSTIGFGTIVDYHWDFGQGDTSIVSAPSNVNYSAGSYNVTLAISSGLGCVDTIVKPLTIYNSPIASFTSVNLCEGNTSTFTNTSSVVSDTIVSFSWDFDDGATSALEFPNHTYLRDTTYQVNLLVQTANSCIHDTTIALTVYDMPVANFSVTEACLGGVTNCTDLSLISNATLLYEWIFDNGDTAVIQSPSVSFATAGMH